MQCVEGSNGHVGKESAMEVAASCFHEKKFLHQLKKTYFYIYSLLRNHHTFLKDLSIRNMNPNPRF